MSAFVYMVETDEDEWSACHCDHTVWAVFATLQAAQAFANEYNSRQGDPDYNHVKVTTVPLLDSPPVVSWRAGEDYSDAMYPVELTR